MSPIAGSMCPLSPVALISASRRPLPYTAGICTQSPSHHQDPRGDRSGRRGCEARPRALFGWTWSSASS